MWSELPQSREQVQVEVGKVAQTGGAVFFLVQHVSEYVGGRGSRPKLEA